MKCVCRCSKHGAVNGLYLKAETLTHVFNIGSADWNMVQMGVAFKKAQAVVFLAFKAGDVIGIDQIAAVTLNKT